MNEELKIVIKAVTDDAEKNLADVKKEKYIQLSKEYTKIPLTLQRQEKEKIRMRYSSKHDNPRDFYYMMNRRYERDLTPCIVN